MEEDGRWITTKSGNRVFIKNTNAYMNDLIRDQAKLKLNKLKPQNFKKDIVNIINNGQVFEFSPGPTMTICSRYENGNYVNTYSDGDSPMGFFEKEIVPYLNNEFVVVESGVGKSRYSRFKKYGYEKVGEMKATKRDIMQNIYTDEEQNEDWRDTWVLMRKKER